MATQKSAHDSAQANPTQKPKIQRTPDRSICRSFESAADVSDKEQTLAHSDIQALVQACDVNNFEVLQGTLRRAHAVATTMAEPRVLGGSSGQRIPSCLALLPRGMSRARSGETRKDNV